jgi:maltose O-acetyltransferase
MVNERIEPTPRAPHHAKRARQDAPAPLMRNTLGGARGGWQPGRGGLLSELDNMLGGRSYDASDPELLAARVRARRLTSRLNSLDPDDDERLAVFSELLGAFGEGAWVETPFHCDYGSQVTLGARVFVNMCCVFLDAASIAVGDDAQLGPGVQLLTSDHPRDAAERASGLESALPISIGARAWLGGGVIVLPGVAIGHDSVIGAGSVVTHSVPAGVTAAGNPCRVISRQSGETQ